MPSWKNTDGIGSSSLASERDATETDGACGKEMPWHRTESQREFVGEQSKKVRGQRRRFFRPPTGS